MNDPGHPAACIARLLAGYRYPHLNELQLQDAIGRRIGLFGWSFLREYQISAADRPDFLVCGDVAVEIKTEGSRSEVLRQLHRYAQSDKVGAIVLVTTKASHRRMPATLNGKRLVVCSLLDGAF